MADEFVKRLKNDPELRAEVHRNPEAALRRAGLPDIVVEDLASGISGIQLRPNARPDQCVYTCIKSTSECTKSYLV